MTIAIWLVSSLMIAVAVAAITIPLVRRYEGAARETDAVTTVLRDQLTEIEGQVARGEVGEGDAAALRTELKRRLLVESRARPLPARLLADRAAARLALGLSTGVALAATALYALTGRPDLTTPPPPRVVAAEVADATGASPAAPAASPVVAQLEARLAKTPGDPEGWKLLGWSYFQAQRFADAAAAYGKALALRPRDATLASAQGEALTQAAGGVVTPQARAAFAAARSLDATDPRARYFLALARDQAGDHRGAIDEWVALLREAPPGAPFVPELRRFVEQAAKDAKVDLAGRLPAAAPALADAAPPVIAGAANARGPDAATVAAAGGLSDEQRQAFIRGMVDNLAAKLAANPRDADGWMRLIRARKVLGDVAAAKAALVQGRAAFADAPATQQAITDAAAAAGVA